MKSPHRLIPYKPDWKAGEVVNPRATDYYRSERVIGDMYRAINLQDVSQAGEAVSNAVPGPPVLSTALVPIVQAYICIDIDPHAFPQYVTELFQTYQDEMKFISATHTLTSDPSVRLTEEEIVVGTIMAKCSQEQLRKDRIQRLKSHTGALVRGVEEELVGVKDGRPGTRQVMLSGLRRTWEAWMFGAYHPKRFGANSFALIALSLVFDLVDDLKGSQERS